MKHQCFECERIIEDISSDMPQQHVPIQVSLYWYNIKRFGSVKKSDAVHNITLCRECYNKIKDWKLEEK